MVCEQLFYLVDAAFTVILFQPPSVLFQRWYESVGIEHYADNIDVTLILPGPVFSDLFRTAFTEESGKVRKAARHSYYNFVCIDQFC